MAKHRISVLDLDKSEAQWSDLTPFLFSTLLMQPRVPGAAAVPVRWLLGVGYIVPLRLLQCYISMGAIAGSLELAISWAKGVPMVRQSSAVDSSFTPETSGAKAYRG